MIGDCPKCGDRMVALFQTPKCERCELGGKDTRTFWATLHGKMFAERGYTYCAVFDKKDMALRFAASRKPYVDDVEVVEVRLRRGQAADIRWEQPSEECISGAKVLDARVIAKNRSVHSFPDKIIFSPVKP